MGSWFNLAIGAALIGLVVFNLCLAKAYRARWKAAQAEAYRYRDTIRLASRKLESYPESIAVLTWVREQSEGGLYQPHTIDVLREQVKAGRQAYIEWVAKHASPRYDPEPPAVTIQWHESPESVHRAMWEPVAIGEGMTYDELMADSVMCGEDEHGQEYELEGGADIKGMRMQGCWAFVDTSTNTIHAWADPATEDALVLHMLAHEIGHITGTPAADDMQEEMRAEQFGRAARRAFELLDGRPGVGVTRWCFKCNTHKPLDQFTPAAPDSPTRDGYNYGCNTCTAGLPKLRRCPTTRRMYDPADMPAGV